MRGAYLCGAAFGGLRGGEVGPCRVCLSVCLLGSLNSSRDPLDVTGSSGSWDPR